MCHQFMDINDDRKPIEFYLFSNEYRRRMKMVFARDLFPDIRCQVNKSVVVVSFEHLSFFVLWPMQGNTSW
jgi:hypothetical protein